MHLHKPTHFLICNDKKPYLRDKLYPGYKGDRKKYSTEPDPNGFVFYDALNQNVTFTKKLLADLDIPLWEVEGLEADDLIAAAVDEYCDSYNHIIVLSNDTDLNQLLANRNVSIYKKNKFSDKKTNLYGQKEFKEEFPDILPESWVDYTAMVGTHNGVPGIKGIGPKTATKILNNDALLEEFTDKHFAELEQKLLLISLPFPEYNKYLRVENPKPFTTNYRKVAIFLNEYGIVMTDGMREAIESYK